MPIPYYQTLMLPLLQALSDRHTHSVKELFEVLGNQFQLTEEEKNEKVPSGRQTKVNNRISWARTYLKKAGLVGSPAKGQVKITEAGIDVLEKDKPDKINNVYLRKFDRFVEFRPWTSDKDRTEIGEEPQSIAESTPEEQLGEAYNELQRKLVSDLLESVKGSSPRFFENLVVELMLAMGYGGFKGAGVTTGAGKDDGIDGVINEDKLGLDSIYLQAKRWEQTVDRSEIDKFIGALSRHGARKGVFITTSEFSEGAKKAVQGLNISIVLIDGKELAKLVVDHDVGVSIKDTFRIKQIDSDYFDEE
ncbi:MAG: restriction endonuclease [Gammaproteobacteria bacterium]|nr:restriction endonuclease [Gammaproteobacteria bacterium]